MCLLLLSFYVHLWMWVTIFLIFKTKVPWQLFIPLINKIILIGLVFSYHNSKLPQTKNASCLNKI